MGPDDSSAGQAADYLRRAAHFGQMDLQLTFYHMLYLCISPAVVYRSTRYHRQTKNQWARDDPGFTAVLIYFLVAASLGFCIAFRRSWSGFLRSVFYAIFVDFFVVGVSIATLTWYCANTMLRIVDQDSHATEQKVEWLYAFDVHCNSYFPLFMILHVGQYFLLYIVLRTGLLGTIAANSLYFLALSVYCYITFLGYEVLPFIQGSTLFLYPVPVLGVLYTLSILAGFNLSRSVLTAYFGV